MPAAVVDCYRTQVLAPVDAELARGDPRSKEYRIGMLDAYALHRLRTPFPPQRYALGTAAADAYFAGVERGHALWRQQHPASSAASIPSNP